MNADIQDLTDFKFPTEEPNRGARHPESDLSKTQTLTFQNPDTQDLIVFKFPNRRIEPKLTMFKGKESRP
jgi:hypothetical protein